MALFFFNLELLESKSCNDPVYLVTALTKLFNGQTIPKSKWEKYKPIPNLQRGTSFLINPAPFFLDKTTDVAHKAQYIRLAGRRNYLDYKALNIKSLDLTLFPDISYTAIKHNPLLNIANNQINFKYEDNSNGT